jgi:hypothetical protein
VGGEVAGRGGGDGGGGEVAGMVSVIAAAAV